MEKKNRSTLIKNVFAENLLYNNLKNIDKNYVSK